MGKSTIAVVFIGRTAGEKRRWKRTQCAAIAINGCCTRRSLVGVTWAPEQIMRGTETWGHACTIRKATDSWQLWAVQCCVLSSTVPCTCCALHFFFVCVRASPASSMMEIRAQPDTRKFAQYIIEHGHHYWYIQVMQSSLITTIILCTRSLIMCWERHRT